MSYQGSWNNRYRYSSISLFRSQNKPYLDVEIAVPGFDRFNPCKAILDTGSVSTLVPSFMLESIGAQPISQKTIDIVGLTNRPLKVCEYAVEIRFNGNIIGSSAVEWISQNQEFILLGRDVLDEHCIVFDGSGFINGQRFYFYFDL